MLSRCKSTCVIYYVKDKILSLKIEFLEALMDRSRPTFESLFGFQELYTIRCNTCNHTTANNAPTSLILHFQIPQNRSQTLQTLFSTNQNVWNTLDDYR